MKKYFLSALLIAITASAFSQASDKHILLEEFSTAPCGFCPDGDLVAQQIVTDHPQVIWVTHHAGFGTDSMTIPQSSAIANAFTTFAPGGCINRGDYPIPVYTTPPYIAISRQKWDSVIVAHENDPYYVQVFVNNDYDSVSHLLNATVIANFVVAPPAGDLRINLFIAEDSVVGFGHGYDQHSYFNTQVGHPYYGMGDTIIGYVHHHVMRAAPGGNWGVQGIIPSAPAAGSSYTYTFSNIPISPSWKKKDIDVIGFIGYYNSDAHLRQVLNSNQKPLTDATVDAIENIQNDFSFSVYPNPVSEKLIVSGYPFFVNKISVTDLTGRVVLLITDNDKQITELNVSNFSSGIYFVKVTDSTGKSSIQKIVVE